MSGAGRLLGALAIALAAWPAGAAARDDVLVIAHRGASGYLPEHTLPAYALAYGLGADAIEPDLVMTADGVLIARHDLTLGETTDVAERYPGRAREDGHYYAADFTWAEIRELRAVEARSGRFPRWLRAMRVPSFPEVLALVAGLNASTGCRVGVYPEIKGAAFHAREGLDIVAALRATLEAGPFDGPLWLQSFEPAPLERLAESPPGGARLVQLIADGERGDRLASDDGLARIAGYADAIGPGIPRLAAAREAGEDLVGRARAHGLAVHAWTLRADALGAFESFDALATFVLDTLDVDGVFTDHPDRLVHRLQRRPENFRSCRRDA